MPGLNLLALTRLQDFCETYSHDGSNSSAMAVAESFWVALLCVRSVDSHNPRAFCLATCFTCIHRRIDRARPHNPGIAMPGKVA
jgi:hypothetical protein